MTPIRVEVALLPLKTDQAAGVAALTHWLDGAECARAASFASPVDRQLFVAAHALARLLLGELGGRAPAVWCWTAGHNGKPQVFDADRAPGPLFSLAHARCAAGNPLCGLVGVAATAGADGALGFDLEAHDPALAPEDLAAVLTPREAAALRVLPRGRQPAAAARLWCLKEAVVKATGEGLAADLSQIGFEGRGRALCLDAPSALQAGAWHLEHRQRRDGSHAAVALRGASARPVSVRWRRWTLARVVGRLQQLQQLHGGPPQPAPSLRRQVAQVPR